MPDRIQCQSRCLRKHQRKGDDLVQTSKFFHVEQPDESYNPLVKKSQGGRVIRRVKEEMPVEV